MSAEEYKRGTECVRACRMMALLSLVLVLVLEVRGIDQEDADEDDSG